MNIMRIYFDAFVASFIFEKYRNTGLKKRLMEKLVFLDFLVHFAPHVTYWGGMLVHFTGAFAWFFTGVSRANEFLPEKCPCNCLQACQERAIAPYLIKLKKIPTLYAGQKNIFNCT